MVEQVPGRAERIRRTLRAQRMAAPFEGLLMAGMMMVATIAKKSLGASDLQITLLMMTAPVCFLLSIYWAELIRLLPSWRPLFIAGGLFGVLPLALMHPFGSVPVLLGLLLLYELSNSLNIPLRNRVMQGNYPAGQRSRIFSRFAAFSSVIVLLASLAYGWYLDLNEENWRWLFLFIALAGLVDRVIWSRVPGSTRGRLVSQNLSSPDWMGGLPLWHRLAQPIRRMQGVLDGNRQFFRWEMQFMLYGLAFFVIITVLPGFLVDGLGLSYSQISQGQVAASRLGGILMLPAMGMFHDRYNPAAFCARIFAFLALFPLFMMLASWLPAGSLRLLPYYLGFFLQGMAMSGVMVAWTMSSLAFAGREDGALYQSIHVTLTGFRGMVGPLLGWLVKSWLGWTAAFALAFFLLLLASILMVQQGKQLDAAGADSDTR